MEAAKNKVPLSIRIIAAVITLIIVAGLLFVTNALFGNPLSATIAKGKIQSYVNKNYSKYDLNLSNAKYNFVMGGYYVVVKSKGNDEFSFNIEYSKGKIYDRLSSSTITFWGLQYKKMLEPILKEEYGEAFKKCNVGYNKDIKYNPLNTKFDKNWPNEKTAFLHFKTDEVSLTQISEMINEIHNFLKNKGFNIENYNFTFESIGYNNIIKINNISEKVINENLLEILETTESKYNSKGLTIDLKANK